MKKKTIFPAEEKKENDEQVIKPSKPSPLIKLVLRILRALAKYENNDQ